MIPARNEAALLPYCLESVRRAAELSGVECFVLVVDDGSTDGSALIANGLLRRGQGGVLSVAHRNVGATRAAGVSHVLSNAPRRPTWIACTDADSIVPVDWIARQLAHAAGGAHGVAGLVAVDRDTPPGIRDRFGRAYQRHITATSHGHVHGANLGVSVSAYTSVGGFAPVRCGEDQDLWARLGAAGYRLLADKHSVVTTSSRAIGRADGGFASYMRELYLSPSEGASPAGTFTQ